MSKCINAEIKQLSVVFVNKSLVKARQKFEALSLKSTNTKRNMENLNVDDSASPDEIIFLQLVGLEKMCTELAATTANYQNIKIDKEKSTIAPAFLLSQSPQNPQ